MIFSPKTTLIALAVGCILGLFLGGYAAWKIQGLHISSLQAAEIRRVSGMKDELQKATEKVLKQERINSELTQQMESRNVAAQQRIASLLADNRSLVSRLGGLYLTGHCEAKAGTTATAPGSITAEANVCRLSDEVAEQLLTEAARADGAAEYASVCYGYVQEVMKQRARMIKEQE